MRNDRGVSVSCLQDLTTGQVALTHPFLPFRILGNNINSPFAFWLSWISFKNLILSFGLLVCFSNSFNFESQTGLKVKAIFLSRPKYWDYKYIPPSQAPSICNSAFSIISHTWHLASERTEHSLAGSFTQHHAGFLPISHNFTAKLNCGDSCLLT